MRHVDRWSGGEKCLEMMLWLLWLLRTEGTIGHQTLSWLTCDSVLQRRRSKEGRRHRMVVSREHTWAMMIKNSSLVRIDLAQVLKGACPWYEGCSIFEPHWALKLSGNFRKHDIGGQKKLLDGKQTNRTYESRRFAIELNDK